MDDIPEKLQAYPKTKKFRVIDTLGVPHPFCITPKHMQSGSMYLGEIETKEVESNGRPSCGMKGYNLMYDEHEQALLVEVKDDRDLNKIPSLHKYLLKIKDRATKDGFVGFAFKQVTS